MRLPAGSVMVNENKRAYLYLISGARSWFPLGDVISFMAYRRMISFYETETAVKVVLFYRQSIVIHKEKAYNISTLFHFHCLL